MTPERPTILLVDGNAILLRLLVIYLKREGFDVMTAATPTTAWPLWQERAGNFDLVVSGLYFEQGRKGIEFLEELRQAKPELHIIVSSGDLPTRTEQQWLHTHRVPFLPKPYEPPTLLGLINHYLRPEKARLP